MGWWPPPGLERGDQGLDPEDRRGCGLVGLYTYAILATVIAVMVLVALGQIACPVDGEAAFLREAEG